MCVFYSQTRIGDLVTSLALTRVEGPIILSDGDYIEDTGKFNGLTLRYKYVHIDHFSDIYTNFSIVRCQNSVLALVNEP